MVKVKCVHCGAQVSEWTTECPKCGKPVANPDAPTDVSASPRTWKTTGQYKKKSSLQYIILGILIVIIVIAVIYFLSR